MMINENMYILGTSKYVKYTQEQQKLNMRSIILNITEEINYTQ